MSTKASLRMRVLPTACFWSLMLVGTDAMSKTAAPSKPRDTPPATTRELIAASTADCMKDWDAATHMTKREWARTCQRVAERRVNFMAERDDLLKQLAPKADAGCATARRKGLPCRE